MITHIFYITKPSDRIDTSSTYKYTYSQADTQGGESLDYDEWRQQQHGTASWLGGSSVQSREDISDTMRVDTAQASISSRFPVLSLPQGQEGEARSDT